MWLSEDRGSFGIYSGLRGSTHNGIYINPLSLLRPPRR